MIFYRKHLTQNSLIHFHEKTSLYVNVCLSQKYSDIKGIAQHYKHVTAYAFIKHYYIVQHIYNSIYIYINICNCLWHRIYNIYFKIRFVIFLLTSAAIFCGQFHQKIILSVTSIYEWMVIIFLLTCEAVSCYQLLPKCGFQPFLIMCRHTRLVGSYMVKRALQIFKERLF